MSAAGLPSNGNVIQPMTPQSHPNLPCFLKLVETVLFDAAPADYSNLHYRAGVTERSVETIGCDIGSLALFSTKMVLSHENSKPYGESYVVKVEKGAETAAGPTLISKLEYVIEVLSDEQFLGATYETDVETAAQRVRARSLSPADMGQLITDLSFALEFHGAAQADTNLIDALDDTLE